MKEICVKTFKRRTIKNDLECRIKKQTKTRELDKDLVQLVLLLAIIFLSNNRLSD